MLTCNRCPCILGERVAQQSLNEMLDALMLRLKPIEARHRAMLIGPLCDACLPQWLTKLRSEPVSDRFVPAQ